MKPFTKSEKISLVIIFAVLIAVSVPNFVVSLRRARDQVRRDDMGVLVHALDEYLADNRSLPFASPDELIMDCLKPGDKPIKNDKGIWTYDPIPCDWGKDALTDLTTGKVYICLLYTSPSPRD